MATLQRTWLGVRARVRARVRVRVRARVRVRVRVGARTTAAPAARLEDEALDLVAQLAQLRLGFVSLHHARLVGVAIVSRVIVSRVMLPQQNSTLTE